MTGQERVTGLGVSLSQGLGHLHPALGAAEQWRVPRGQASRPQAWAAAAWCRAGRWPRSLRSPGCLPQVILACNSGPALNDVTYSEALIVAERIAAMDPTIQ